MIIAGIDYSMTSPGLCIHNGAEWSINNCKFYFRTDKKKLEVSSKKLEPSLFQEYSCQEERFWNNAQWAVDVIVKSKATYAVIEGYAMGAKGKVFHIGEHTAMLKHLLWKNKIPFDSPPPTVVKKFATGKGNANKEAMEVAFELETNFGMRSATGQTLASNAPSADLIDAYAMAKYGFFNPPKSAT